MSRDAGHSRRLAPYWRKMGDNVSIRRGLLVLEETIILQPIDNSFVERSLSC